MREVELLVLPVSGRRSPTSVLPQLPRAKGVLQSHSSVVSGIIFSLEVGLWQLLAPRAVPSPTAGKGLGDAVGVRAALKFLSAPCQ